MKVKQELASVKVEPTVYNAALDTEEDDTMNQCQREPYELADNDLDIKLENVNSADEQEDDNYGAKTGFPFKCEFCSKSFRHKRNLCEHNKIHTNGVLEDELSTNDLHRHKCPHCPSSFVSNAYLTKHIRIHTGERPYKCNICSSSFRASDALKLHIRIHTGEKPFKCPDCDKSFSDNHNLLKHRRRHTNERPYKCPHPGCIKDFREKHHMKRHLQTKHHIKGDNYDSPMELIPNAFNK
ncbi:zinc finger protein 22-like [Drosophila tropicalis]|uniref:zinc finger protein 22-like n=1 Tax=Drosophila tropicalis TaxID=46794 RepID=UPI0035AC0C5C